MVDYKAQASEGVLTKSKTPPSIPTLTIVDNEDGTGATATVSGADTDTTNIIYTMKLGLSTWTAQTPISGNGSINMSITTAGYYWAFCKSTDGDSLSSYTQIQKFKVSGQIADPEINPLQHHSCAEIIAQYLINQELFTNPEAPGLWPIYINSMPDGNKVESNCACVYDTPGTKDGRLMRRENILFYQVQLRIRSKKYNDGWEKATDTQDDLDSVYDEQITIDNYTYVIHNISQLTPITDIGDEKDGTKRRKIFVINFKITVKEL